MLNRVLNSGGILLIAYLFVASLAFPFDSLGSHLQTQYTAPFLTFLDRWLFVWPRRLRHRLRPGYSFFLTCTPRTEAPRKRPTNNYSIKANNSSMRNRHIYTYVYIYSPSYIPELIHNAPYTTSIRFIYVLNSLSQPYISIICKSMSTI